MILVFGMKQGTPQPDASRQAVSGQCPVCGQTGMLQPVKQSRFISLFFIPVIPVGGSKALRCPNCGSMLSA